MKYFGKKYKKDNKNELRSSLITILSVVIGGAITIIGNIILTNSQIDIKKKEIQFQEKKLIYEINHQNKIKVFTNFSFWNDKIHNYIKEIQDIIQIGYTHTLGHPDA